MITDLFSIPIYTTQLNISKVERKYIIDNKKHSHQNTYGNFVSNNNFILNDKIFQNINSQIDKHIDYYTTKIFGYDASLKITQSWVNYNHKGSSHHTHSHPNSIFSGVIYLTNNPSKLFFFRQNTTNVIPYIKNYTPYNSNMFSVDVKEDMIIIFPSYVQHGVDINTEEESRVSLAFNTFYTGDIGDKKQLTFLELK